MGISVKCLVSRTHCVDTLNRMGSIAADSVGYFMRDYSLVHAFFKQGHFAIGSESVLRQVLVKYLLNESTKLFTPGLSNICMSRYFKK